MARARKNAASKPTDAYARAIAAMEGATVALVEMTTSEDSHHAQCSAFTLLNLGEVGLSGMESVFNRTRDTRLRYRIVELLRGASLTHGVSALRILGRLAEADDLDPLLQAMVRSSFAEALGRAARPKGGAEAGRPSNAPPVDEIAVAPDRLHGETPDQATRPASLPAAPEPHD